MFYLIVAGVLIYFGRKLIKKKNKRNRAMMKPLTGATRSEASNLVRRHSFYKVVYLFFNPLDSSNTHLKQKFAFLDPKFLSASNAACLFIAHKLWVHQGRDLDTPLNEICDQFLDSVALQLQSIEDSEAFRSLADITPAEPPVAAYQKRSTQATPLVISDAEIKAAFEMCVAASKIIQTAFDQITRDELQTAEHIPGAIAELEDFLNKRKSRRALYHKIVFLKDKKAGDPLTPEQRLYQIYDVFRCLERLPAAAQSVPSMRKGFETLNPERVSYKRITTTHMANYLFAARGLSETEDTYGKIGAFDQRVRAEVFAFAKQVDLARYNDVLPVPFPSYLLREQPFENAGLGRLSDQELLVLSGFSRLKDSYEYDRKLSATDHMVIQLADMDDAYTAFKQDLERKTKARKMPKEERIALAEEQMKRRLEKDPLSVVLRPQVPIRFDEEPRSWLGGLPKMPQDIVWPRGGAGHLPMHFAAQICCADLPAQLWAGMGPRQGWLLLFMDGYRMGTYDGYDGDDPDGWAKVIHIDQLGPERTPPGDISGVKDLIYAGADYDDARDEDDVPSIWRKWPIDLVPQKIELEPGKVVSFSARQFALKSTTAAELYGLDDKGVPDRLDPEKCPPLTWGGVVKFIRCAIKKQRKYAERTTTDQTAHLREQAGWVQTLVDNIEESLAEIKNPKSQRATQLEQARAMLAEHTAAEAERKLSDEIADEIKHRDDWWCSQTETLENLLAKANAHDPFASLSDADWAGVRGQIAGMQRAYFGIRLKKDGTLGTAFQMTENLIPAAWPISVAREHYLDLYAHSPRSQGLIPQDARAIVQRIAREVRWGRPHRMGGLADPLQADIGPEDPPLLFQIASDDAVNWMWGDAGAVFIHTSEEELSERAFTVFANFECH